MLALTINNILIVFTVYVVIGLIFAIFFCIKGLGKIDPVAKEGSKGFRVLMVPGSMALWPVLARRWFGGRQRPPRERDPHRDAARQGKTE